MHFRTILLPSFTIQNILKVLILFMNWGKRNPDKSNASYRIVHIHACIYTAVLQIYGSLMVNHVNLFFCSPSFLSQRKTSFHSNIFTSKRNIEGPFVFRSWRTYIYLNASLFDRIWALNNQCQIMHVFQDFDGLLSHL